MNVSAARRWQTMRALYEGEPPSFERLSALTGLTEGGIQQRAEKEGWRAGLDDYAVLIGRLQKVHGVAVAELAAAADMVGNSGFQQERVDAAALAVKTADKLASAIGLAQDQAKQARERAARSRTDRQDAKAEQDRRDAELAEVLRRIDTQIVRLAHGYARELVERGDGPESTGLPGQGRPESPRDGTG